MTVNKEINQLLKLEKRNHVTRSYGRQDNMFGAQVMYYYTTVFEFTTTLNLRSCKTKLHCTEIDTSDLYRRILQNLR